jgi:hypothetical protein
MLGDPLQVTVHPDCWYRCGDISNEAAREYNRMLQQDQHIIVQPVNSINVSCSNQSGSCLGLNPNPGIYWTGIFILAGCVVGAIVIRKVRK